MTAEARTCGSCGHGHAVTLQPGAVECRESPPQVVAVPGHGMAAAFPQLIASSGCSKWTPQGVVFVPEKGDKPTEKTTKNTTEKANGTT